MKIETAWSMLKEQLKEENGPTANALLQEMSRLEGAKEPEFVYRIYSVDHDGRKGYPTVGSKYRMTCLLNHHKFWYDRTLRSGGKVVIERASDWSDVTGDFAKWLQ